MKVLLLVLWLLFSVLFFWATVLVLVLANQVGELFLSLSDWWKSTGMNLSGLAGGIVSLCALFISLYNVVVTRAHQRLSMRPVVNIDTDISPASDRYSLCFHNCGPGLAIVETWRLSIDGVPCDLSVETSRSLTNKIGYHGYIDFNLFYPGDAIQSGNRVEFIGTDAEGDSEYNREGFKSALSRLSLHMTYQSVYNETWTKCYRGDVEWRCDQAKANGKSAGVGYADQSKGSGRV
jgi:hypothetical protein